MVSFELGKEIEKDFFSSCHERGTKKKCSVPIRNPKIWGSIPHGESEFFLCLTLVTRRKNIFLYGIYLFYMIKKQNVIVCVFLR